MIFSKLKENFLVRAVYNFPGVSRLYHFLWAFFGAVFYGFPSEHIFVIGVTGTKGKTTTLELLNSILEAVGKKTALLSSLRIKIGGTSEKNSTENSMPGRGYIQKLLRNAVAVRCQYALIEVTSQGAALHRHRFIKWNVGVMTNLSPEHIEAHGSFEKYRAAKLEFLKYTGSRGGKIFINKDDANAGFFLEKLAEFRPIVYSKNDEEVSATMPKIHPARGAADIEPEKFIWSDFNKENVAAAIVVTKHIGISEGKIDGALRHFTGVPGRMEFVQRKPFAVVIDYAHTPDSLRKVYETLRREISNFAYSAEAASAAKAGQFPISKKLICVLGAAGGGRDKWKRPEIGKIAAEYCDEIILTDEDPYDENPLQILSEIKSGVTSDKRQAMKEVLDRREAIRKAINAARDGDCVVITGKGSEDWIHVAGHKKIPWSEKKAVEEALVQK